MEQPTSFLDFDLVKDLGSSHNDKVTVCFLFLTCRLFLASDKADSNTKLLLLLILM